MRKKLDKLAEKKAALEKKKNEISRQIRQLKSKEAHEQKKRETHYKFLVGAFMINEIKNYNAVFDYEKFKRFINDDEKYNLIIDFLNQEKFSDQNTTKKFF